ncbi:MAG TPA: tetratricopeptide repeat protein [Usitatibacter sp.]|nr:tetratricopeptide repeat protein [Usitatibacter sp.]
MSATSPADPFRLLQDGDAQGALRAASAIAASDPGNARAHLAAGIALRVIGRADESRRELELAARLAPNDYAPQYELGVLLDAAKRTEQALAHFERCTTLRPGFAPGHFAAGVAGYALGDWARAAAHFSRVLDTDPRNVEALVNLGQCLAEQGRHDEAEALLRRAIELAPEAASARHAMGWLLGRLGKREAALERHEEALARNPDHVEALRAVGRHEVSRGNYARAAGLYARAATLDPGDRDLALYAAQTLLLVGRWGDAWFWYARRDSRIAFEAAEHAAGRTYRVPALGELRGREAWVLGEQGLGDVLFFLRFAPRLRSHAARVSFAGDRRLHSLLERTHAFDRLAETAPEEAPRILAADLPLALGAGEDVFAASLRAPADAARAAALRERLAAAGPRPWIAVTWRSGTPREKSAQALSKSIAPRDLLGALAQSPGTVFAFQRAATAGELAAAREALRRPVHDLSDASEDPEDALAVASLVDRHIGVSSTNMHLAALAGASAEVLVPFPPEWRWRPEGDSPWFPGFRVLRQSLDGDWSAALAALRG